MKTQKGFKLVKVGAQGVQFGNAWFSHEKITGGNAEELNAGAAGIHGLQYMAWLSTESPADSAEGCYEHALKAMEGETDRLRAATIQVYYEAKERGLFEAYAKTVNDKVNLKIYTAAEGYIYVCGHYKDVSVQTSWLTWQACAKSRAGIHS